MSVFYLGAPHLNFELQLRKIQTQLEMEEYEDLLMRITAVEPDQEEMHNMRHKLRKQDEELVDLRRALSDATVNLHTERDKYQEVLADCAAMRDAQVDDRKRMQELLALVTLRSTGAAIPGPAVSYVQGGRHITGRYEPPQNRIRTEDDVPFKTTDCFATAPEIGDRGSGCVRCDVVGVHMDAASLLASLNVGALSSLRHVLS